MTTEQVIAIIGQFATWITVLIVFLTLREMEKQRKASQKPEIIISQTFIYGYFRDWNELLVPTEWSNDSEPRESTEVEKDKTNYPKFTLYNIGIGAAKSVKLEWIFDVSKLLDETQNYCYQNSIPIVVNSQNDFLKIGIAGQDSYFRVSAFSAKEHEYILPASVTSKGIESDMPMTFLKLISILIYMMKHQADQKESSDTMNTGFPELRLKLSYYDIGGVKYQKSFDVKLSIFLIHFPQDKSDIGTSKVSGVFEFAESRQ
jgi:hypothetical protein